MNTEKLYKELTVFCKNKGLEEREAAYLLGLFTNYAEALRQQLVSSRHNLIKSMLADMDNVHPEYHYEIVADYLNDGC